MVNDLTVVAGVKVSDVSGSRVIRERTELWRYLSSMASRAQLDFVSLEGCVLRLTTRIKNNQIFFDWNGEFQPISAKSLPEIIHKYEFCNLLKTKRSSLASNLDLMIQYKAVSQGLTSIEVDW